jgi:hypothetical protein
VKITPQMIEAARQALPTEVSDDAIRAALEAALAAAAPGAKVRPSPALRIVTTRTPPLKTVAIPKTGSPDEKAEAPPLMASARRAARINA